MQLEKRDIVKCIILSIITCGIYAIVWAVKLAKDGVKIKDVNDDGLLEVILAIFIPFLGFYLIEKKFAEGCVAQGIPHEDNSVLYLIIGLFMPIIDYCLLQNELNKLASAGYVFGAPSAYNTAQEVPYEPVDDQNQQN